MYSDYVSSWSLRAEGKLVLFTAWVEESSYSLVFKRYYGGFLTYLCLSS